MARKQPARSGKPRSATPRSAAPRSRSGSGGAKRRPEPAPRAASTEQPDARPLVRLQKFLASAGFGSRRHCEEFITAGRVSVDGTAVTEIGTSIDPSTQQVALDGEVVRPEPRRYYLLHKPTGVVCTARDPQGRPRAIDLVPQEQRLFTVGRLDESSTGLLLVTNDGGLAQRLAHPRFQMERIYQVQVAGIPDDAVLQKLRQGLHFSDGHFQFQRIRLKRTQKQSALLEVMLTEGRNREIRRLFARAGHKVLKLKRIGFGPLRIGRLPEGSCRPLRNQELKELRDLLVQGEAASSRSGRRTQARTSAGRTHASRPRRAAGGLSTSSGGSPSGGASGRTKQGTAAAKKRGGGKSATRGKRVSSRQQASRKSG